MDRRDDSLKFTASHITFDDMEQANRRAGMYWWEPDTLRFFRSRMVGGCAVRGVDGRYYFVTSEQNRSMCGGSFQRLYSVRVFNPETAGVDTIGPFQAYRNRSTAVRARDRSAAQVCGIGGLE